MIEHARFIYSWLGKQKQSKKKKKKNKWKQLKIIRFIKKYNYDIEKDSPSKKLNKIIIIKK